MTNIPKEVLETAALLQKEAKMLDLPEGSKSALPKMVRIVNINDKGIAGAVIDFELMGRRFLQMTFPPGALQQLITIAQLQQHMKNKPTHN